MTLPLRPRRLALLVASTAIAAGGALLPTTAFAAAPAAPHQAVADGTGGGVHVPDRGQTWQCFAAPCEPPGSTGWETGGHDKWDHHDKPGHDKWDHRDKWDRHDKKGHDRPGRNDGGGVHVPEGEQQWQCFAAPCEPPTGARN
ncbi:hypothetical protein [Streptomyces xanthophaeus]|uniref:hypothetical protein n=1 Tax=Streptomyces xanthophaeus TaxID=67385 RepID=UPI0026492095|nr:hypothetical protein [Streptomyces xanthophaeus]WKD36113.1 hypothetical protein KO717_31980 [Streptomyces xanthophaeus]